MGNYAKNINAIIYSKTKKLYIFYKSYLFLVIMHYDLCNIIEEKFLLTFFFQKVANFFKPILFININVLEN